MNSRLSSAAFLSLCVVAACAEHTADLGGTQPENEHDAGTTPPASQARPTPDKAADAAPDVADASVADAPISRARAS